jgi:hypothetical protein
LSNLSSLLGQFSDHIDPEFGFDQSLSDQLFGRLGLTGGLQPPVELDPDDFPMPEHLGRARTMSRLLMKEDPVEEKTKSLARMLAHKSTALAGKSGAYLTPEGDMDYSKAMLTAPWIT